MNDPILENLGLTRDDVIAYFGRAPKTPPSYRPQSSTKATESGGLDLKRAVLKAKAQGLTNLQVARELRITQATVARLLSQQSIII